MASHADIEALARALRQSAEEQRKSPPESVTARMCGYVRAFYQDFPDGFSLGEAMDKGYLPATIKETYKIDSGTYADRSVLSTQLSDCGLLSIENGHRNFRLTPRGVALAQILRNETTISGAEAL